MFPSKPRRTEPQSRTDQSVNPYAPDKEEPIPDPLPSLKKGTARPQTKPSVNLTNVAPSLRRRSLDPIAGETVGSLPDCNGVSLTATCEPNHDYPWNIRLEAAPVVRKGRLASDLAADPDVKRALIEVVPNLTVACYLTLFVAREKTGKTTFLAFCASEVTLGIHHKERGRVLWCGLEEPVSAAVQRFENMGADLSRICIVDRADPETVVQTICDEIRSFRPALVIIDSLSVVGAYMDLREKSEEGWTLLINKLRQAAQDHGCGIVMVHHARKADGEFRGSTAIAASVDQVITMHEDDKDGTKRRLSCRGRWTIPSYSLTYEPTSNSFTRNGQSGDASDPDKDDSISAAIVLFVQQNPGANKTQVTTSVRGNAVRVRALFDNLVSQGQLVNRPGERGWVVTAGRPHLELL